MSADEAYTFGWREGRFFDREATQCEVLALIEDEKRLAFWAGHKKGRRVRESLVERDVA